jgi:hypothetical protein
MAESKAISALKAETGYFVSMIRLVAIGIYLALDDSDR